jgi:apolipoprotein N-acyltransferase
VIHRGRALALAAAAGTLIALCWLPTGLAPVMPLSALLMMRALRAAESRRDAALLGLAFGLLRYAVASHFLLALLRFSGLAVPFYLMAISFILPLAVLEAWGAMVLERWTGLPRSVGFGLLYVVFEKLRTVSDLSFPADLLAHGFGTNPSFLAFAPWFGPFGVSLTVMAVGALLDAAIEAWPRRPVAALRAAAALGLWLAAPAFDAIGVGREAVPRAELTVGIVQPDTPIEQKVRPEKRGEILAQLRAMTLEVAPGSDVVLWPETARPGAVAIGKGGVVEDPEVAAIAREAGKPILYGAILAELEGREVVALYNGAVLVEADGSIRQWYGKQRLLPFVEAVPFAGLVGFDARARARSGAHRSVLSLLGNFTPGPEPTVFEIGPARLGVLICYEGFYPALARKYAREGANALAVLTNDSWWGWSAFATWHARMIAARARENELPVVRAANGGISSATDQRGRLGVRSGLAERRVLQVPLAPARGGPTFYARFGDWILSPLLLAPIAAYVRKKRA